MVNAAERPLPPAGSARATQHDQYQPRHNQHEPRHDPQQDQYEPHDQYDPQHPMWSDPFWERYCRQPPGAPGMGGAYQLVPSSAR